MDYRDKDSKRYYYVPESENLRRERGGSAKRAGASRSATTERVRKRIKEKERKAKRKKALKKVAIVALFIVILCTIVFAGVGIGMYTAVSTEINDMNLNDLALNHCSFIVYVDENGNEVELEQIKSAENRKWVPSEEISINFKNAAVAIEDERFYSHKGIDIKRTAGATIGYVLNKIGIGDASYGGSTITQQVVKNITNEKDRSVTRKVKEMMRAVSLEKQLTKDEILTMYLNVIYLANNCYGVEAASDMYFGKTAAEVTIAEAATIVGITQRPSAYDPYAHPEAAKNKRNTVLDKMLEHEMITEEEHEKAVNSPLKLIGKSNRRNANVDSYFVDQVVSDVKADLQAQKGYSAEFAEQQLINGGMKIYATIDVDIQKAMESVFEDTSNFPSSSAQAAMAVIDPYTGEVKGLVGGLGEKTEVRGFNRATQAKRQPGSAIKPLAVYAPAIEYGKITQATVIKDEKITVGSDDWEPSNAYSGFKGLMPLHEAIGRSANIPAVKVLDMIGINRSYSFLEDNFKISSLVSADKNFSSLSLGGLTKGVSVKEMAAAYGAFVNSGKYIKPYTYTKVVDGEGQIILENKPSESRAMKETTAYLMADLLSEPVNGGYGTARSAKLSEVATYGKTGTTNDNHDKWFVGFTPYYVGAVWYGYDSPKSVGGSNPTTSVWKKVMEQVHEDLGDRQITRPKGIVEAEVCTNSGKLAKSGCESVHGLFESGTQPKRLCDGHVARGGDEEDPEATEEATESPSPTPDGDPDDPENTTGPGSSDNPDSTQTPEKTQAPASTKKPEQSQPVATAVPSKKDDSE